MSTSLPRIAYIGLGNIGRAMSSNLARSSPHTPPLLLYNRTASRATSLAESLNADLGADRARAVDTVEEAAAGADVVWMCLGDDETTLGVVNRVAGVEGGLGGKTVVQSATVLPETMVECQRIVEGKGGRFVGCPVFGTAAVAAIGKLILVPAGPASAIAAITPLFASVSRATIPFPDASPAQAANMKLIGNSMVMNMVSSLSEAFALAETTGVGDAKALEFVRLFVGGPFEKYGERMVAGDYYGNAYPQMPVDLALKDCRHMLKVAGETGAKLPSVEVAVRHLDEVKSHLGREGDLASVYGAARKAAGLRFEKEKTE